MKNKDNLINSIQKIRSQNNINWMNLMRLAFKYAPKEASAIVKKINLQDKKISQILKKLEK
jgi:hypothetical protein|tara:strand:+ start:1534 stop:1716 length:183 start_codon:yes stop_codon:yes gene_type:complete